MKLKTSSSSSAMSSTGSVKLPTMHLSLTSDRQTDGRMDGMKEVNKKQEGKAKRKLKVQKSVCEETNAAVLLMQHRTV